MPYRGDSVRSGHHAIVSHSRQTLRISKCYAISLVSSNGYQALKSHFSWGIERPSGNCVRNRSAWGLWRVLVIKPTVTSRGGACC